MSLKSDETFPFDTTENSWLPLSRLWTVSPRSGPSEKRHFGRTGQSQTQVLRFANLQNVRKQGQEPARRRDRRRATHRACSTSHQHCQGGRTRRGASEDTGKDQGPSGGTKGHGRADAGHKEQKAEPTDSRRGQGHGHGHRVDFGLELFSLRPVVCGMDLMTLAHI